MGISGDGGFFVGGDDEEFDGASVGIDGAFFTAGGVVF